jgi:hypothetical protein
MMPFKLPKLPRGVQIIEVESMNLIEKDVIFLKNIDDFLFLLGDSMTVFRLNDLLYAMSAHVAYVYDASSEKRKEMVKQNGN